MKLWGSSTLEDTDGNGSGNGNGNGNDRGMRFVGMSCAFQYQQLFLLLLHMNFAYNQGTLTESIPSELDATEPYPVPAEMGFCKSCRVRLSSVSKIR